MEQEKQRKPKAAEITYRSFPDGSLLEQVKDYSTGEVGLAHMTPQGQTTISKGNIDVEGVLYKPVDNSITRTDTVLFPSEPSAYQTTVELRARIVTFIHKYVDLPPYFEKLASYYVLLSWVFDAFNVVPYLRVIGEPGTGKSRFLEVMAAICYKGMRISGAISVASIFRILEQFAGTLILDEADLPVKSDEYASAIKILNCGYQKGLPVIRQEKTHRGYTSVAYPAYGPKVIATRQRFRDLALETRMITERMGKMRRKEEIPLILPESFANEALVLRNQLLSYRFMNFHKVAPEPILALHGIEPRLSQITGALVQVMDDPSDKEELLEWAKSYTEELKAERAQSLDGEVVKALFEQIGERGDLSAKAICDKVNEQFQRDADKVNARTVGGILRKLGLQMKRASGTRRWTVDLEKSESTLQLLSRQYGVEPTTLVLEFVTSPKGG